MVALGAAKVEEVVFFSLRVGCIEALAIGVEEPVRADVARRHRVKRRLCCLGLLQRCEFARVQRNGGGDEPRGEEKRQRPLQQSAARDPSRGAQRARV